VVKITTKFFLFFPAIELLFCYINFSMAQFNSHEIKIYLKEIQKHMEILFIIGAAIVALVLLGVLITTCYVKAIPTEAVVVTGAFHKEPKFVTGRGVLVLPFIQRADRLIMKVLKLDVKTPQTGVKTAEGVPLWIDSVVTVQVYNKNSTVTDKELAESGYKTREEFISSRQRAAITNFLGTNEMDINNKVNDMLQGNLREIVAEMSVMDVLTKRKEFAARVMENARPDLAKVGLEVVTFNIQDVQDAVDGCGKKHGVVEAIGTQREMEIMRDAEQSKAAAKRDIEIARAEAEREAAEKRAVSETLISEAKTKQSLRESELKAQADKAAEDARAAGLIRQQEQEKLRREAEAEVQIAAETKEIERAEKQAEVEQRRLDAEVRKRADAAKYQEQMKADAQRYAQEQAAAAAKKQRELEAESRLFEIAKESESKKIAAEAELEAAMKRAQAIEAEGRAEAAAIEAKGLAEAQAIDKRAEAMQKYGEAAKLEMMYNVLPQVAQALASVLSGADNVTIYGADAAGNLMSNMTQSMNQFMNAMADGTGKEMDMNALAGAMLGSKLASGNKVVDAAHVEE
jgi:flotillin